MHLLRRRWLLQCSEWTKYTAPCLLGDVHNSLDWIKKKNQCPGRQDISSDRQLPVQLCLMTGLPVSSNRMKAIDISLLCYRPVRSIVANARSYTQQYGVYWRNSRINTCVEPAELYMRQLIASHSRRQRRSRGCRCALPPSRCTPPRGPECQANLLRLQA